MNAEDDLLEFEAENDLKNPGTSSFIHIRVQQRLSRKFITIIEGIGEEFDLKKILKYFKKTLNCNGSIVEEKDGNKVMQLTGDQRQETARFFVENGICTREQIKIHGA